MWFRTKNDLVRQTRLGAFGALIGGAALFALGSTEAGAQTACTGHSDLAEKLGRAYSEAPVARGLVNDGALLEVYSTGDGNTWTMVLTMPNGVSCVVAVGEAWTELLALPVGETS